MPLTSETQRKLLAESHRLKPAAVISATDLSKATIAHIAGLLARQRLLKVRIRASDGAACDAAAAELAAGSGADVVKRVGRVVLLYSPERTSGDGSPPSAGATT